MCIYLTNVKTNFDEFMEYMGKISDIIKESLCTHVCILGNFNAGVGTLFENELLELCRKHSLHMSDYSILGRSSGTFTYISDAHLTTSWLDHVSCSYSMNLLINSLHVLDKLPCSDHLPMVVIFDIDINASLPTQVSTDDVITSFNWSKATVDDISSYSRTADVELRSINVPGGLMCRDMHCHDVHHLESIDLFYSDICNALAHSSAQCIDKYIEVQKSV